VRIPALEIDNGEVIIDSTAILDHLDEVAGANSLLPQSGQPRREAMKLVATAVGAMEKTVSAVYFYCQFGSCPRGGMECHDA